MTDWYSPQNMPEAPLEPRELYDFERGERIFLDRADMDYDSRRDEAQ